MLPPTLIYGFVPVSSAMLSSKLFENSFGFDLLPAKSGKNANSIENDTNPSGIGGLAPSGVAVILI